MNPWAIVAGSLVSAGAGIWGANEAADDQKDASKRALAEQQRQFDAALGMLEPNRALGYGATSDLSSLYGYRTPAYTPLNELTTGSRTAAPGGTRSVSTTDPFTVKGRRAADAPGNALMGPTNPLGGGHRRAYGGEIDPITGTVNLTNIKNAKKEAKLEDAASAFLRGETDKIKSKKLRRIRNAIEDMRDAGYTYDPEAANAPPPEPTAGPIATAESTGTDGTAGNFGRFFTSPDYQFRQQEGTSAIDRSAAARGGVLSGNTIRAQTGYASNLAAGEYGNYVNRLLAMAGLGQTATNTAVSTGANYANNAAGIQQNIGDARASGVMGAANSIGNAVNGGLNSWLMYDYMTKRA
jgi:hypothetical protein